MKYDRYLWILCALRKYLPERGYNALGHLVTVCAFFDKRLTNGQVVEIARIYYSM